MLRIGHRGARAYAPENTIASFKKALEIGVDAVELDVRKTKDKQLVVIHDADVKRTTDGEGLVCELTLKEIKGFSAEGGEKIPTLEEALDFLDKKVKVFVELKEEGTEEQVLRVVHDRGLEKNVVIVSFLEDALRKVRVRRPDRNRLDLREASEPVEGGVGFESQLPCCSLQVHAYG